MEEAFTFWGTPEGDLVHPAECMEQLLEKVRRHRVNIDGNVCTVMVTTLVLEVITFLHFIVFTKCDHTYTDTTKEDIYTYSFPIYYLYFLI